MKNQNPEARFPLCQKAGTHFALLRAPASPPQKVRELSEGLAGALAIFAASKLIDPPPLRLWQGGGA